MSITSPPFNFNHKKDYEIKIKYKNIIYKLYKFRRKLTE